MFSSIEGLAKWYAIDEGALQVRDPNAERHLNDVETRLTAYIVPQYPKCDDQARALETAAYYQYDKERGPDAEDIGVPEGATSISVGKFSMSFGKRGKLEAELFPAGLAAMSRSSLLLSGLLYRGVNAT